MKLSAQRSHIVVVAIVTTFVFLWVVSVATVHWRVLVSGSGGSEDRRCGGQREHRQNGLEMHIGSC
jgi:hypothetical protein